MPSSAVCFASFIAKIVCVVQYIFHLFLCTSFACEAQMINIFGQQQFFKFSIKTAVQLCSFSGLLSKTFPFHTDKLIFVNMKFQQFGGLFVQTMQLKTPKPQKFGFRSSITCCNLNLRHEQEIRQVLRLDKSITLCNFQLLQERNPQLLHVHIRRHVDAFASIVAVKQT